MPILEITSYRVGVAHKRSGGATRYLFLEPPSGQSGPGSGGVKIYFEAKSKEVGQISGDVIVAMLPEALRRMGPMWEAYKFRVPAARAFPLGEVNACHEVLGSGKFMGKLVLIP